MVIVALPAHLIIPHPTATAVEAVAADTVAVGMVDAVGEMEEEGEGEEGQENELAETSAFELS